MEIALIFEGSYPFVSGGVSTWAHQLITELSDLNFKILSIMPSRDGLPTSKYKLPANVTEMQTIYLDDYNTLPPLNQGKEPRLSKRQLHEIEQFLSFDQDADWQVAMPVLTDPQKIGNPIEFLKSKMYWEFMLKLHHEDYASHDFNRFFWTMVSMYLPLITMLQHEGLQADIYHPVSTGYAGLLGLAYKIKYNKPLILTEHGVYAREREEEIIKAKWVEGIYKKMWIRYFYFISTGVYKQAELVISLFQKTRALQIELGADSRRALVIPNGVDTDRFKLVPGLKKEGKNIGSVLRVVPIKDVKTLIRAFKIVQDQMPDTKLYIIGGHEEDINYYHECRHLASLLNLTNKIIFTGQADTMEFLPKLDLLVLTSVSEGQPLVMLEGMAAGIPFVVTDVGSCRELIEGIGEDDIGPCGIVTQPASPDQTAQAIMKILTNLEMMEQMGNNAVKRVEKYYTQELLVKNYREVYTQVFAGKQQTGCFC
ncbi:MAG: GT4 family glycosyltransferase PelF [Dethiobacter sp.]|jgi:glycosyltransferase involved in cell wall biosynthesis|nr:GT4 family glycosyltransferase PelF [Dethiobacter sp.]